MHSASMCMLLKVMHSTWRFKTKLRQHAGMQNEAARSFLMSALSFCVVLGNFALI